MCRHRIGRRLHSTYTCDDLGGLLGTLESAPRWWHGRCVLVKNPVRQAMVACFDKYINLLTLFLGSLDHLLNVPVLVMYICLSIPGE